MLILNIIATYVARHLVIRGFEACMLDRSTPSRCSTRVFRGRALCTKAPQGP